MPVKTQHDQRLGTILEGAYRITRLLGEGGMGAVYEAIQLRLNKRVAIKLLACRLTANNDALARFRREAEITSRLGHPNLVNVIDFGTSQAGEPYLVMEYLEGEDLESRLSRCQTLPVPHVVHIVKQAASALAAAHAQGVVHRDLKPANVFLVHVPGEMDFVKVLDFGVSKVKAAGVKLTKAAVALGTPTYMSPEQASGKGDEIDHPADQWALACIAWEMLTGRGPFYADDVNALFYQILNLQPPSLLLKVPSLEPEAELVLLRALAKSPRSRFPSIRDFAHAFEAAALGRPADVTPLPMVLPSPPTLDLPAGDITPKPKQLTTFSRTTGEIADRLASLQIAPPRRLKPRYALGVVAGAAVVALTLLLARSHSPKVVNVVSETRAVPVAAPPAPSAPSISPLASTPTPSAVEAPTDTVKLGLGKIRPKKSHITGSGAAADTAGEKRAGKKKMTPAPTPVAPLQPRVKRTIIREL